MVITISKSVELPSVELPILYKKLRKVTWLARDEMKAADASVNVSKRHNIKLLLHDNYPDR